MMARRAAFLAITAVLALALVTARCAAEVTVGGVTYDHVDPGEPFTAAEQPRETHEPPRPTGAERSAGLMAYYRPAPELLRPWSRPRPDELIRRPLKVFAALGQTEATWVALYALQDLTAITARVGGLPDGVSAELFVVHFWPQRTSWRTRQYYITPELLLPYDADAGQAWFPGRSVLVQKSYDLKAGTTGALWLRLTVETATKPGEYNLRLRIKPYRRGTLSVPLRLTVLPFKLRKPADHRWLLYGDLWRWRYMSDKQRWLDAKDFAAHGIDGIVSVPIGTVDLTQLKSGRVEWDITQTRRYLELLQQAGLRGPWVMSGSVARAVRDALGIKADLYRAPWPEPVRRGVQLVAAAIDKLYSAMGLDWYFYGWDEPSAENIYAVEQYKNWHLGGAPIYVTICRPGFWEAMAPHLDAPCFSTGMIRSQQACEETRSACQRLGKQFWWYGSGCYIGQEGRIFPNRFLAGYFFWKTGARCQVSWTYTRPHEDPFNDFDGVKANRAEPKEQCTIYPWWDKPGQWSSYRGPIQTIQWEALREGIDDFCYLWTLYDEARRAAAAPSRARARAGRQAKRAVRDITAMLPWLAEVGRLGFDNADCQTLRWLVAQQIIALREEKLAAPGSRPETREVPVKVTISPAPTAEARSLPVAAIPRTNQPPAINGRLDDAAWQSAARLPINRNARTGERVKPEATALLLYDDRALYVAFKCFEPAMSSLVATKTGRDPEGIWLEDSVELFLDPTGQRKKYVHFIVNAAGAIFDEVGQDKRWDSSATVAVARFDDAWAVEMAIPWADLAAAGLPMDPSRAMALNACRNRRADRRASWENAAWSVTYGWYHVPSRFGIALLETGPVGLVDIHLPRVLGPGQVRLVFRNRAARPLTVSVTAMLLDHSGRELSRASAQARVQPDATKPLVLPVRIAAPGRQTLRLIYSAGPTGPRTLDIGLDIAPPASIATAIITIPTARPLLLPLELNVAPGADRFTFEFRVRAVGHQYWRGRVECPAGHSCTMEARAVLPVQPAWLTVSLLGPDGSQLWHQRLPMLPAFDPLS